MLSVHGATADACHCAPCTHLCPPEPTCADEGTGIERSYVGNERTPNPLVPNEATIPVSPLRRCRGLALDAYGGTCCERMMTRFTRNIGRLAIGVLLTAALVGVGGCHTARPATSPL